MVDPKYTEMIEELGAYVSRKIEEEWKDSFGSMVLISAPRGTSNHHGDVTGWAAPEVRATRRPEEILLHGFFSLAITLIGHEEVTPEALHKLVMAAAVQLGMATVIVVDEEGNAVFDGTDDSDLPQA